MLEKRVTHERKLIALILGLTILFFALMIGAGALWHGWFDDYDLSKDLSFEEKPAHMYIEDFANNDKFTFSYHDTVWECDEHPEDQIADIEIVGVYLAYRELPIDRVITKEELDRANLTIDDARFGFNGKEAWAITYTGRETGKVQKYVVGKYNPLTKSYYFMVEGRDDIYTISYLDSYNIRKDSYQNFIVPEEETEEEAATN